MQQPDSTFQRLYWELKRRHVIRVVGGYTVALWAVLQVADIVLPALMAPDWVLTLLVVLGAAGFVLAAVLAWIYDLTDQGIHRTDNLPPGASGRHILSHRAIDYVIIGALSLILAFVLLKPELETSPVGRTVAVLPFADLSVDQNSRYFGDGIAEAIMDQLAGISGIQVSARTSSFSFRSTDLDARRVARELGVETLLEGSVRKSGDRVRVSARLIDGEQGIQVWGETFEGALSEIFEVQDQIATAIAQVMRVQLDIPGKSVLITDDTRAYDLYLRGRDALRQKDTLDQARQAVAYFSRALTRDPQFALAAAGLCSARWETYELGRDPETAEAAMQQCRQVEQQHGELAETRIAIGKLLLGTGKPEQAAESFQTALARAPNNAEAHSGLAAAFRDMEQFEPARAEIKKAIKMDPAYWRYRWEYGVQNVLSGQLDAAVDSLKTAIRLNPDSAVALSTLGGVYFLKAEFLLAADAFERSIERSPNPVAYSNAGTNYFFAGQFSQAEAMFARAVEMSPEDFRWNSFLAWAIRAQSGREGDAEPHHRKTITIATERLAININDHEARAALAVHLAALGHEVAANGALASLDDYENLNMNALSMAGFAHYFLGQTEKAATTFKLAIENGLPAFVLHSDPRLNNVWSDERFAALVESSATDQLPQ
ncbi:MAG: tetratricopeptide repeat protein [Wenzhouxiangellaceae bacterium]|nr:tetratricopeptide repeat protein [Wenzhouxiangellaceae bacterium]